MTTADLAYEKLKVMPEIVQQQALDYIDYLLQKWQKPVKPANIEEEDNSQKILALLNEISSRPNSFSGIDGVEWQKEQRQDKVLFGREEY